MTYVLERQHQFIYKFYSGKHSSELRCHTDLAFNPNLTYKMSNARKFTVKYKFDVHILLFRIISYYIGSEISNFVKIGRKSQNLKE